MVLNKQKRRNKYKKKRKKRNSISASEDKTAWEDKAESDKRARIKKQRSVVDHMKRIHSKIKTKKIKKRRERLIFALKVFGGIFVTAAEIALIFI
jgi:hypothetical protein